MNVFVFGGTTEGGRLADLLSRNGHSVTLVVTTRYAAEILPEKRNYDVMTRRLDGPEMIRLLGDCPCDVVVDATHPYAEKATRNIREACEKTGVKYLRLSRSKIEQKQGLEYVADMATAAEILSRQTGNVFLAVGSKELECFTRLRDFERRCFVRILPMMESLKKAIELGFRNSNIICMQGPFSEDLNRSMLSATNSKFLVTKDSGEVGGFDAKIAAARRCDCRVIVVERPVDEAGFSFEEIEKHFDLRCFNEEKDTRVHSFFPLFFDMKGRRMLVVGGGKVGGRRVAALYRFGAKIRLISPLVDVNLREAIDKGEIEFYNRAFEPGDVERFDPFLVIAATDERKTNDAVAREARARGVPVVVADRREQCDCYFPAIAENDVLLAGLVAKDGNHKHVRMMAERIRRLFDETDPFPT